MSATMRSRSLKAWEERNTLQSIGGYVFALLRAVFVRRDPAKPLRPPRPDGTQVRKSHQLESRLVEAFPPLPRGPLLCSSFPIISPPESDVNPSFASLAVFCQIFPKRLTEEWSDGIRDIE